jgi:single-strand DNA-binding protein
MSRGINSCHFIGNLGRDAETRYSQNGSAVCNFSIACTEVWMKDGEKQEKTEWVPVVLFGKLAEAIAEYLLRGTTVYVQGKFRTEKWQDRDGKDRYTTKVYADTVQLLGSPRGGGRDRDDEPQERRQQQEKRKPPSDDFDDDIPFMWAITVPATATLGALLHASQALLQV